MTIEEEIAAWATGRPVWQQSVLQELAHGHLFSQAEVDTLARELKAGIQRTPAKLKPEEIPGAKTEGMTVSLCAVREATNVNALIDGQELTFAANGLTVVYGDNASGKSGYARVIKDAVEARHHERVHQNVFLASPGVQGAQIEFGSEPRRRSRLGQTQSADDCARSVFTTRHAVIRTSVESRSLHTAHQHWRCSMTSSASATRCAQCSIRIFARTN